MKISINSGVAANNRCWDREELKKDYAKIFRPGIKGVDQSVPPICADGPLANPRCDEWAEAVLFGVTEAGGEIVQCHCPLISPTELVDGKGIFLHEEIHKRAYDDVFRMAKLWDCPVAVHPITFPVYTDESYIEEYVRMNIEYFKMLSEIAGKYNVKIAAENLFDVAELATHYCRKPEVLKAIVDGVNSENLGVCVDTGHANVSGVNPCEFLRVFKDKVYGLHIHDNNGKADQHKIPTLGNINWGEFLKALKNIGYTGFFNYEVHGDIPYNMSDIEKMAYFQYVYQVAADLIAEYISE